MTAVAAALRARGREPDARLAPYLKNFRLADFGSRYAGGVRPLPQVSLTDLRKQHADRSPTGGGVAPEAVHFAIFSERYSVPPESAIAVPRDHLWWIASAEDTVLLSDTVTSHYTTIAQIDRATGRIHFRDPWPDNFFLLPDHNVLDIAAQRESQRVLSISKAEFLRCAVGLLVWDTSKLVVEYLAAFPEQQMNPDIHLCFGFTLLAADADLVAVAAAVMFAKALALLTALGDNDGAVLAARQTYLAAACGLCFARMSHDEKILHATQRMLNDVLVRYNWIRSSKH